MARTKQEIDNTKIVLNASLGRICDEYQIINSEMSKVPHQRARAQQILDSKTGQYIMHSNKGFNASYTDSQGQRYTIQIRKEDN